jgi:hypothetical protein
MAIVFIYHINRHCLNEILFKYDYIFYNLQFGFESIHAEKINGPISYLYFDWTCWGPSASEGPQKRDLTIFSKYARRYLRNQVTGVQVSGQDEA